MVASQRNPSKWTILAIVQSLIWMFGTPWICKKYWNSIFGSMSNEAIEWSILTVVPIVFFLIYNIVMLPVYYIQHPLFEQFKIQRDRPWPWLDERESVRRGFWALSKRSVSMSLVNLLILLPLMGLGKLYISAVLGSAFKESWPSMVENFRDIIYVSVLHELGFYATHRIMHTFPNLYKYHMVHHEYISNTTLASQHNHPIDFILSIGGPALLAVCIVEPHPSTFFQFTLWTMYANLDDHVGYAFPWSPVRWFPLSASTDEHEFHHSKNLGCFGSKLSIFNSFLGGYEHYNKNYKKLE